ncbi:MarR family transcriptional regulator [Lentzea sp. DG1S-22]|uniref:MarR family winged helix-turn-helix transcriptional regulator n=1 Tax=Lentzea sp. DG1S-22 TaxID=3108822 RepID=UPI002E786DEA|nr:MarR family transcriptional regulator [Lentzea sp. DG1S-22]WVH84262.1 MarR family transcriptional regulator [Lentzea sp. DG1S-22]
MNEQELRTWRSFLLTSLLLQARLEREPKRETDLSFAHYDVLSRLSEAPGRPMRMADLAADSVFGRGRLCHTIDRLARNGWVRRGRCPTDRRGHPAELTDEGMAVVRRAAPAHVEQVRPLVFDRLTLDQRRTLREISEKLVTSAADPAKPVSTSRPADR